MFVRMSYPKKQILKKVLKQVLKRILNLCPNLYSSILPGRISSNLYSTLHLEDIALSLCCRPANPDGCDLKLVGGCYRSDLGACSVTKTEPIGVKTGAHQTSTLCLVNEKGHF